MYTYPVSQPQQHQRYPGWGIVLTVMCGLVLLSVTVGAIGKSLMPTQEQPTLQTVHSWQGSGHSASPAFYLDGTKTVIRWQSLTNRSDLMMNVNLRIFDTEGLAYSWASACDTTPYQQSVQITGMYQIEVIAAEDVGYRVEVLQ